MHEDERREHLDTLKRTPARLRDALKGVPRRVLLWTPAPGKWSILEIVCHMRDMEREAYLARYRRILSESNPELPDIDGDVSALEGDYRAQRLGAVVRDWRGLRRECLSVLRGIKGELWRRTGTHETAGPLTVEDLVRRHAVGNDAAHLGQIDAIKRRFEVLERLGKAPGALAEAVRGLDAEAIRRRPDSGGWSIVEIACHLRDVERLYAERFTKMAHQDGPSLRMADNDRLAEKLRYRDADVGSVVKEFRRLREDTLALLRALPQASWQRTGRHPTRGEVTIEALVSHLADHDGRHLERARSLR